MALSWDDLRLVKAVAERGGLTQAAAFLGINHSTAFRRLGAIEAALDARLFERHRSGYAPTQAGEAFAALAARMEDDVARVTREVMDRGQAPAGVLRVTAATSFVAQTLMPLFAQFRERYPLVQLDVVASQAVLNLSRRDADVAIRASGSAPENLVGRRIGPIGWAIYGRTTDGAGLSDRDWVSAGETVAGGQIARFVRARTEPERVVLRLNTVQGLTEAVEAGIGIGPLPCIQGDRNPALMRLGGVEPELASSLWLLTHPELRHAPRVRAFMDVAADWLTGLRSLMSGTAA